eukprot:3192664-Rhodomonas_salina.1
MCGTDVGYAATLGAGGGAREDSYLRYQTETDRQTDRQTDTETAHAECGTAIAYAATRCPVLSQRMVLQART